MTVFFFQAEDGIRDYKVTGVQTCALPIVNIALSWARGAGTSSIGGLWNTIATGWIEESGLGEREATHVFALLDAAMMDAAIGCWDAKLTYWFIRPPQADPAVTLIPAIGLPNHPPYPSADSCHCA